MERILAGEDLEVMGEFAGRSHGLSAHAGPATFQIVGANIGDQSLQGGAEAVFADRLRQFLRNHRRVPPEETPETGKEEDLKQIDWIDFKKCVALARKGQDRVWASFDPAVD